MNKGESFKNKLIRISKQSSISNRCLESMDSCEFFIRGVNQIQYFLPSRYCYAKRTNWRNVCAGVVGMGQA